MEQNFLDELKKPFPADAISWRIGQKSKSKPKAKMLCYIDARDVMDRLDKVCGYNWSDSYQEVMGRIVCTITIGNQSRTDGAGDTDIEAEKGGLSDAFKRAAVKWGVGRYLYNAKNFNTWVETKDADGKDLSDFDLVKYPPNKKLLDEVAKKLSAGVTEAKKDEEPEQESTEKTPAQKAAETRAQNKQAKEEALQKYDICMAYLNKTNEPSREALNRAEDVIRTLNNWGLYEEGKILTAKVSSFDQVPF